MREPLTDEQKWCLAYLKKTGFNLAYAKKRAEKLGEKEFDKYTIVRLQQADLFDDMAKELKKLWPKGSREINGKEYPWQESASVISKRLSTLYRKRNLDGHSMADVLECARRYLSRFEGNLAYMKSLHYWILRYDGSYGHIEEKSVLADMLENKDIEEKFIDEIGTEEGTII